MNSSQLHPGGGSATAWLRQRRVGAGCGAREGGVGCYHFTIITITVTITILISVLILTIPMSFTITV